MHTLRRFALFSLSVALLLSLSMSATAGTPDKLLPSDSEAVATINFKQMLGSQLFKKYEPQIKAALANDPRLQQSLDALGLDPWKDIDSVTFSNSGSPTGDKMLIVARGRFDLEKISKVAVQIAANQPNFKISKAVGRDIYEGSAEGKPIFGTFVDDKALALSPSKDYLLASIQDAGKKGISAPLQAAIKTLDDTKSVSIAAVVTKEMKDQLKNNPQAAALAPKLQALTSTINLTDAALAVVNIHTTDAQSAQQIGMLFQQVVPLLKVLAAGNEQFGPVLNDLLATLKVGTNQRTISISLKVTEDMVMKALQMAN